MRNLFLSGFIFLLALSGCGYNGTPTRSPQGIIPPTSIEIVPVSLSLPLQIAAGTSTKLKVYGYFAGVRSEITQPVDWKSDNTGAAITEQNNNRVRGVASGTANITATFDGVTSVPIPLTVSNATVTGMTITTVPPTIPLATPTVLKGSTKQFAATGTFSDSSTQDLTFDVTWSSSPGTFATISNDQASKGLATATAIGVETITATFIFDTTKFTTSTLTVIELKSIAVTPANSSIEGFKKTVQFKATGTYSDNSTNDITSTVIWDSSQKGFATITSGGLATTVAAGTTSISATQNGISGKTDLTVTAVAPPRCRLLLLSRYCLWLPELRYN
jgi:hypothetical protein